MNLSDLQLDVYETLGYGSPIDPKLATAVTRNLNISYHELLGRKGLSMYRRAVLSFSCIANSPFVVLPMAARRVITIQDRTNNRVLDEASIEQVRYDDPGLRATSTLPDTYVILNLASPVVRDPSAAAELFAKSSSALDTSGLTAYLNAIRTGGYPRNVSVALNGTTAVSFGATVTDLEFFTKFYLGTPAQGDVTLHQTSGAGTELSRIPVGKSFARYSRVMLHPTPTQANTYFADVELRIDDLTNPYDEPLFDDDYHWVLSSMASMRGLSKKTDAIRYEQERTRSKSGAGDLILLASRVGGIPQQLQARRFSQLGSYFPVGT